MKMKQLYNNYRKAKMKAKAKNRLQIV